MKAYEHPGETNRRVSGRIELFLDGTIGKLGLYQTIRPLVVGLVHGLAGSAAVALSSETRFTEWAGCDLAETPFSGVDGHWTQPTLAPFSGEWPDSSPAMSPDGSYLIFESNRPKIPLTSRPNEGEPIPGRGVQSLACRAA